MNKDQASQRPEFVPIGVENIAFLNGEYTDEEAQDYLNDLHLEHLFIPPDHLFKSDFCENYKFLLDAKHQLMALHDHLALSEQNLFELRADVKERQKNLVEVEEYNASEGIRYLPRNYETIIYQSATLSLWSILENAIFYLTNEITYTPADTDSSQRFKKKIDWIENFSGTNTLSKLVSENKFDEFQNVRNTCAHGISDNPPNVADVKRFFYIVTEILNVICNEPTFIKRINATPNQPVKLS